MNVKKMYDGYVMNTYTRGGPVFVKGKGSWLWDEHGGKYLDFFPGWGVGILGHAHPALTRAIAEQAAQLIHIPNNLYHPWQGEAAKEILAHSFKRGRVFFGNSGTEAVEAAIKLAKAWGRPQGRTEIVSMKDSFHGRSLGALSCTAQGKYQDPFKPLIPGCKAAVFGDMASLERQTGRKTAAVIIEPIQGEGGVNFTPEGYLKELRAFCDKNGILLIFDEVQTGMGRTGNMFAYQTFGVVPDVMTLSKGLGGGFPVGCCVVNEKYADVLKPGMHASTFGGSPLAARVICAVFDILDDEKILQSVRRRETVLARRLGLLARNHPVVKEVRGVGLMWAVELHKPARPVYDALMKKKMIANVTHDTVMRIMPALNIDDAAFERGLSTLEKAMEELGGSL